MKRGLLAFSQKDLKWRGTGLGVVVNDTQSLSSFRISLKQEMRESDRCVDTCCYLKDPKRFSQDESHFHVVNQQVP